MARYSFDLSGRVALVTGASSGLGARFARLLAASGARVGIAARRIDNLTALAAEIGPAAVAVAMDVADEASIIAGYDAVEAAFGPVDTIVANAGISIETAAVDMTADDFRRIMDVNVTGVFLTLREGARRLIAAGSRARGHGRMVVVASITADIVAPPEPGRAYFEQVLKGDDWDDLPASLKNRYAASERLRRELQDRHPQREAAAARDRLCQQGFARSRWPP